MWLVDGGGLAARLQVQRMPRMFNHLIFILFKHVLCLLGCFSFSPWVPQLIDLIIG